MPSQHFSKPKLTCITVILAAILCLAGTYYVRASKYLRNSTEITNRECLASVAKNS